MDVLLLKNIKNLGDIGSKVSVKSGYARNYLLPNNLAVLSSKENLAIVEEKKQLLLKQEEELRNQAINIKEKELLNKVKEDPKIGNHLKNKDFKKTIFIPNKLINIII